MSTNFAWKHEHDVKLWRHKRHTPNTNGHHLSVNETPHENFLRTPLLRVHYCKRDEAYLTSLLWQVSWRPCIVNAIFRIAQNHGEQSYFRRVYGGRSPQSPALDPPLISMDGHRRLPDTFHAGIEKIRRFAEIAGNNLNRHINIFTCWKSLPEKFDCLRW